MDNKNSQQNFNYETQQSVRSHFSSSPSRAGVEGCPDVACEWHPPPDCDSAGLLAWRLCTGCPAQRRGLPTLILNRLVLRRFVSKAVARAENSSALQSRGGDGFSPSSRARSLL